MQLRYGGDQIECGGLTSDVLEAASLATGDVRQFAGVASTQRVLPSAGIAPASVSARGQSALHCLH